jgi:glycosyltransferase involved in cell wall biosynthesis
MSTSIDGNGGDENRSDQSCPGPPRVLVVADHLGYPGGVWHGVTTYFIEVLPALVQAGVDLQVVYLREPHPAADTLRDRGISPVFLSAARANPVVALQVAAMARRGRRTVMHAMGIKATLMARMASQLVGSRTILHLHDLIVPGSVIGRLQRTFARRSDMAVCVSGAAVPIAIRSYGVSQDRVRVIHNGIDTQRFASVPAVTRQRLHGTLGISPERRVLLLVGRMHPVKGHREMLQAMPAIVRECPDVLLLVAGDGPERAACEALVAQAGLDRHVKFLGQRRDIPELLHACDLLVIPSQSEGLPIAAIEAHAAGKPVVGFDVGGVGEVVQDGVTGRVVPAADIAALADSTSSLLKDVATLAAYGDAARRVAQSFALDAHVRSLIGCYHEIAGSGATGEPRLQAGSSRQGAEWAS